ncbi:MAG TPA: iron chelate uptake ABC transporter family permease subunit [Herpetosiphonaceae bacterium]
MNLLYELFFDYTLRNIALGSAILGIVGGILGSFALLRKQALLGDALSHAALPGICLAYMLTGSKTPLILLVGAGIAGWIGTLLILRIIQETRISEDAALGIVLTVFFGFGIMLLTFIQHSGHASQSGLDKYLFGQAATLVQDQVTTMAILGGVALLIVGLLFKEFKLITFDPAFAATLGFPVDRIGVLLTLLIVVAVLIGLQTVGVVLMAAMLIAPAAAARQWTERLSTMLALAALFGALSGVTGALISISDSQLPTGPMVILSATAIVIVSLLFGRTRGIVWEALRTRRNRRSLLSAETRQAVVSQRGGQR